MSDRPEPPQAEPTGTDRPTTDVPATAPESPTPESPAPETPGAEAGSGVRSDFFAVVFTTFTTVFLAELGDKTQLAALLLSAESGRPVLVFVGAALALICSSLVGVLLGRWLAALLPAQRLERISGVLMVSLGLWLGGQALFGLFQAGLDLPNP
jgi:putative Ca2+/H+ antiporter (TMEM165/GDT1 family)